MVYRECEMTSYCKDTNSQDNIILMGRESIKTKKNLRSPKGYITFEIVFASAVQTHIEARADLREKESELRQKETKLREGIDELADARSRIARHYVFSTPS